MLTSLQKEILNGLMLGDGGLEKHKNCMNPSLRITRVYTDLEYLLYNAEVFQNYLTSKSITECYETYDKRTGKKYFSSRLRTKCSEDFLPFYKKWYPEGKKIIPKDLELTPLTIAIWIADDGHISNPGQRKNLLNLKFSTHGFSEDEVYFLSTLLKTRYNFIFPVYNDSGKYVIRLNHSDRTKKVLQDIDPIFPESMNRKSNIWRCSEAKLYFRKTYPPCKWCLSTKIYKNGTENGKQKYQCQICKRQFI